MIKRFKQFLSQRLWTKSWAIGLVDGGISTILSADSYPVFWVKMPRDRWFADPFILDVNRDEIQLLVEDYEYSKGKGCISLLCISRKNWAITKRKVLLDNDSHLSFPCILRKNGEVYVYPENCVSGRLDMYHYDLKSETLSYYKTICDDSIWDSVMTDLFGETLLFTSKQDDYHLDIYIWNVEKERFLYQKSIVSDNPNCRMGGQLFCYENEIYYPAQDCSQNYGGAIEIKKIEYDNKTEQFHLITIKKLFSPHKRMTLGFHTLNEYKGFAVIDVQGYRYSRIVSFIEKISKLKKRL